MADDRRDKILDLAVKYSQGLTIDDVVRVLEVSRTTAARDLEVLMANGKLKMRQIGKVKIYYLPKYLKEIKLAVIFLLTGFFVFHFITSDGIAIFNFNSILQEIFFQSIQIIFAVGVISFAGIFLVFRISGNKIKRTTKSDVF